MPVPASPEMSTPCSRAMLRTSGEEAGQILKGLCASPGNQAARTSGGRWEELEAWFEGFWLALVAEHGAWVRRPDRGKWEPTVDLDVRWKDRIRPILPRFAARAAGPF